MKLSSDLQNLFEIACRSEGTVLLSGPTGSGKTSLAKEIHDRSARRSRPFVMINLASVHAGTIESELFGHERGAFTGADQRRTGKLEQANGGTVFLDEIGEIPSTLQAKLLEFLQSKTISPVGGNRAVVLDVRVIAATHRDLAFAVRCGEFREDLFHRLRVIPLALKPLAERWDEFDEIIHKTLEEFCARGNRKILRLSEQVAEALEEYDWPGNIRELRNVLEFAVSSCLGEEIQVQDLPPWFFEREAEEQVALLGVADSAFGLSHGESMRLFERHYLLHHLRRQRGRINRTARQIKMNKTTLIRRIREHQLDVESI